MERESCLVERVGPVRLWDACLGERAGSGRPIMERAVLLRGWVLGGCEMLALAGE